MDINAFMEPLIELLAVAALWDAAWLLLRRILSGAVEEDGRIVDD